MCIAKVVATLSTSTDRNNHRQGTPVTLNLIQHPGCRRTIFSPNVFPDQALLINVELRLPDLTRGRCVDRIS